MVREDIVGGLKNAIERGSSFKDAMTSFYNTGYDKNEIEEAAKYLLSQKQPQNTPQLVNVKKSKEKFIQHPVSSLVYGGNQSVPTQPIPQATQFQPKYNFPNQSQPQQNLAEEGGSSKFLIITLASLLGLLLITLIFVFLTRNSLISFFNKLF